MTPVLLSVIVPVYNVESCLRQCLDSLAKQTIRDKIEFILINDGSPDSCGSILAEYAKKYPFFHVITQENRGFAGARNRGLEEARGKYIGFVDSDDWIEPDMFEKLLSAAESENAEIAQCSCIHHYESLKITLPMDNSPQRKMLQESHGNFHGAEGLLLDDGTIWNRLFRKDLIDRENLRFDSRMSFGEDVYFYWRVLIAAKKIVCIPDCLYHYRRQRAGSQTNSGDRRVFAYFTTCSVFRKDLGTRKLESLYPWSNHLFLSYLCFGFERLDPALRKEYFQKFRAFLKDNSITADAEIAAQRRNGNFFYNARYFVLEYLHPLTLHAIVKERYFVFCSVVAMRVFLSRIPLYLINFKARFFKKKGL